jgi:hypothetical protein
MRRAGGGERGGSVVVDRTRPRARRPPSDKLTYETRTGMSKYR